MIERILIKPNGERVASPGREHVRELLHQTYDEWVRGSGDASLTYVQDEPTQRYVLLIVPSKEGKFFMEFIDKSNEIYNPFISLSEGEMSDVEIVIVGAEEHVVPRRTFVSRDLAEDAIVEILETGSRSSSVRWARRTEIRWSRSED